MVKKVLKKLFQTKKAKQKELKLKKSPFASNLKTKYKYQLLPHQVALNLHNSQVSEYALVGPFAIIRVAIN
jgi:hypothetical protein